jgi:AcrR family transcriptional regulator
MPDELVLEAERRRIMNALAGLVAERGYGSVTLGAIIARAGVSQEAFYWHFRDKHHCFLLALDDWTEHLLACVVEASSAASGEEQRLRAAVEGLLGYVAADPNYAKMAIVESLAAGPRAIAKRARTLRQMARLLGAASTGHSGASHVPALLAEGVVAGIVGILYSRIVLEGTFALAGLTDDLVYFVATAITGHRVLSSTTAT